MSLKTRIFAIALVLAMVAALPFDSYSQNKGKKDKKAWPDSLTTITVEGVVLIDSTHANPYLLDVDADTVGDYFLAFGPDWYVPESGAERPVAGDTVTIVGHLNEKPLVPVIIVFEINDLLWREAIENWWKHQDFLQNKEIVTETGVIMLDTTHYYTHYYLDTDADSVPDYFLSFGAPWYEPESGAVRPAEGDEVTIEGIVKAMSEPVQLVVLKINELVWRDETGPAPWVGGWFKKSGKHNSRIHCPIDTASWLELPAGAMMGGGKQDEDFPDSIFIEFMQTWRDSLPACSDSIRAGWYFHFSYEDGNCLRSKGRSVNFMKSLKMKFNFDNGEEDDLGLAASSGNLYELKYYDEDLEEWVTVDGAEINPLTQSVTVETESVNGYYAVFETVESTNVAEVDLEAVSFVLEQNYPNPFNPETRIQYQLAENSIVQISVFNILGQKVRTLVNSVQPAGVHQVVWNGRDEAGQMVTSGMYIYKMQAGARTDFRRMVLLK